MNDTFLKIASGTDYKHDFDTVTAGLRFIMNNIQGSYDPEIGISQSQFIKNFITVQGQIDAARATSVYALLQRLPNILLREPYATADILTEYNLLRKSLADLDMADIGSIIADASSNPYIIPKTAYSVFAVPVSERTRAGEHTEYTLASVFAKLTPAKKIALLIDSSCISFTSLLIKKALEYEGYTKTEDTYEFYIIHSVECDADPALKVNSLELPSSPEFAARVSVFFLRDDGASVTYTTAGVGANLFSTVEYTLSRGGNGDVDAIVRSADGSIYTYEDVKHISSIRTAATELMKKYIKGGETGEVAHYAMLKRNGDWCQALSLLDTQRLYTIYDASYTSTGRTTTLHALQKEGVEISLVTLDTVLLSYAITLGIDTYFTYTLKGPERNQNWLLYFQNSIRMAPDRILALFHESILEFDRLVESIPGATRGEKMINAETKRQELITTVRQMYEATHTALNTHYHTPTFITTFPDYYIRLQYLLDTIGRWTTLLTISYAEYYAKLSAGDADPKTFITDLYVYKQLYAKIVQIYQVEKEIESFTLTDPLPPSYSSGLMALNQLRDELLQGKVPVRQYTGSTAKSISSENMEQARELVFLPIVNARISPLPVLPLSTEVPADTSRTITLAYKGFYDLLKSLGAQTGGGDKRVLPQIKARHMITVRPIATLPYAGAGQFEEQLDDLGVEGATRDYILAIIDYIYTVKQRDYDEKALIAYVETCIDKLVAGLKNPDGRKRGRAVNVEFLNTKIPILERATAVMKEIDEEDDAFLLKKVSDFQLEPGSFYIDSDRHRNLIVDEYIVDSTMYEEIQAFVGTMTMVTNRAHPYIAPTTPDEIHFVCIRLLDTIAEYIEGLYDTPQPAVVAFVYERLNALYALYKGFRDVVTADHIQAVQAVFVPFKGDTSIDESIQPETIASLERMVLQLRVLVVFRYYAIRYRGMTLDKDVLIRFIKNICPTAADIGAVEAFTAAQGDDIFPGKLQVLEACAAAKIQKGGRRKYTRTRRRSYRSRRRSHRR